MSASGTRELTITIDRASIRRIILLTALILMVAGGLLVYSRVIQISQELNLLREEVMAKDSAIRVRDVALQSKQKLIAERDKTILSLRAQVEQFREELGKTTKALKTTEQTLAQTGGALRKTQSRLGQATSQLGETEGQLQKQKALTDVFYSISQENLRNYCRSLDNEVLLARNSLKNLRRLEAWMGLVEYQIRARIPYDIWEAHRKNVAVSEENLRSGEEEQRSMQSLCQAVR